MGASKGEEDRCWDAEGRLNLSISSFMAAITLLPERKKVRQI